MINAGRVLIIPKGEWTNLESYEMLDLVTRGDIAYIARQASVGVDPATDTQLTYWQPFGTAAKIATTTTPGLVMPDGTTVTIDATGLISANIGISDINNVTITSISNGQILQYNSSTQRWENKSLGSAASRNATSSITSGSTDLIESGAVNSLKQTLTNQVDENTADINIIESSGNWRTGLRFKNLGTSFTSAQQTALANGDFREFWNGDYWVIGGHNWRIVDNSGIARRKGDTNFDSNSLVIMPDDNLVVAEAYLIDDANDSGHGYNNCAYRTRTDGKGRAQCKSIISSAFGSSHIASHRELMSTARGTSGATSWAWTDADVEFPSEANIYGHSAFSSGILSGCYSPGYNIGSEWGQFMLFRLAPYMAINRSQNYWLRDIASASGFAGVHGDGVANYYAPSIPTVGLRPHFILV